jgi:hypothetical protein
MPYIRLTGGTARLRKLRDAEKPRKFSERNTKED